MDHSSKSQSALEYMMTYGWAILIIVIVAGVLYSLGIFNPTASTVPSINGFSGLGSVTAQCQAGGLALKLGNSIGSTINITAINVTVNGIVYTKVFPSFFANPSEYTLAPSQSKAFVVANACPNNTGRFSLSVSVQYNEPTSSFNPKQVSTGTVTGSSVAQYPLYTSTLVGFWPLDTGSGTTASDFAYNSTGTLAGLVKWNSNCNFQSYCLNFTEINGTSNEGYVQIGPHDAFIKSFGLSSNLTFSLWIKLLQIKNGTNAQSILGLNHTVSDFQFRFNTNQFNCVAGSGSGALFHIGNFGQWYNIICTEISWPGNSTTYVTAYINGIAKVVSATSGPRTTTNFNTLYIGVPSSSSNNPSLNYTIQYVQIYNYTLSAAQVSALYNSQVPFFIG